MKRRRAFTLIRRKGLTLGAGKGFTLIESLAVIAIIGILMTITTFTISQAQRSSRDAKRKNDLYAISQGFAARQIDKTCPDQSEVGLYPGLGTGAKTKWVKVAGLATDDSCNGFNQYLATIPTDPQSPNYDYYFNLSTGAQSAKHYRLAASLERQTNGSQATCQHDSDVWASSYLGFKYDCVDDNAIVNASVTDERGYLYYIGQ